MSQLANALKADENGSLIDNLRKRQNKIPDIRAAAKDFESKLSASCQRWRYYRSQLDFICSEDVDNNASILRNAVDEYAAQLRSLLALPTMGEENLRNVLGPEDVRYDESVHRFVAWVSECEQRLR
jgi:hypothetical protein